jgi:molecular chaperone HscB
MIQCPSCGREGGARLLCEGCGAPLGAELDCFTALGLPRRLVLSSSELQEIYHRLSRQVHPDRFATRPAAVREASLRSAAVLTRSYRTLREPVSRGLYWLELNGEKLAENNKEVPADLVELVFDVQERLQDLRGADKNQRAALQAPIEEDRSNLQRLLDDTYRRLTENFVQWDQAAKQPAVLTAALKEILSRIAYLSTLIRDVDRRLEEAEAA